MGLAGIFAFWRWPRGSGTVLVLLLVASAFAGSALAQAPANSAEKTVPQETPGRTAVAAKPLANFTDIAKKAGLNMQNVFGGVDTKKFIIETTGTGVAIFDYDNDGWPDIFLVNGTTLDKAKQTSLKPTSRLFHNNHDGTFSDVTKAAGLEFTGWGQGVCVGDYDNDGFDDLYVTYYGKNRLYHNEGNGHFKEVAEQEGVAGDGTKWGTGCAFVDY